MRKCEAVFALPAFFEFLSVCKRITGVNQPACVVRGGDGRCLASGL